MNSLLHPSFPLSPRLPAPSVPASPPSSPSAFLPSPLSLPIPRETPLLNFKVSGSRTRVFGKSKLRRRRKSTSGIPVPRQRYIPISKGSLLHGLLSMIESQEEADQFRLVASKTVADMCERFMYDKFKEKVKMPIDSAMNTLLRLGLVSEVADEENKIQVLPSLEAYEGLKKRWDCLLGSNIL